MEYTELNDPELYRKADHPPVHREVALEEAVYIIQPQGYFVMAPVPT